MVHLLAQPEAWARTTLRQPSAWAVAVLLLVSHPTLALAIGAGLAPPEASQVGGWLMDLTWLGSVTGVAQGIWWLGRSQGFDGTLGGSRQLRARLVTLLVAAGVGGSLPILGAVGLPAAHLVAAVRTPIHVALLGGVVLRAIGASAWSAPAFLAICWVIPALLGSTGRVGAAVQALTDPRSSGVEGWWIVAAGFVLAVSVPRGTSPAAA